MTDPLVSILLSLHNEEKYVLQILDSITKQTYRNIEIIIVDDGSADDTCTIVKNVMSRDDRIILLRNEINVGLTKSLNKALAMASGVFFARVDADDLCSLTRIERSVNEYYKAKNERTLICQSHKKRITQWLPFTNVIIHSSVFGPISPEIRYDEKYTYSQDYELWLRLKNNNWHFVGLSGLVNPVVRPEGISMTKAQTQRYFALQAVRKHNSFVNYILFLLFRIVKAIRRTISA